jgi:UDPglucose 6-dehydrogenase
MKVAMIGVGKLGAPCADEMHKAGHTVTGYDINPQETTLFPVVGSIKEAVEGAEMIFIAVPTPHDPKYGGETPTAYLDPKDFDYSIVKTILEELNDYCTHDQLVVLISTVLPGTTRTQFIPLVKNYRFIYNPYLIAMGSVNWDMINPEMIIIGTKDGSVTGDAKILTDFYKTMMVNDPRYEIGTWDEAECIKIFYNTYISSKIGLVNMIMDVAEASGNINVDVVTDALSRSTKRITGPAYLKAGMGDSGACHPRDNIALRWLSQKLELGYDLFGAIMDMREIQARKVAEKLVKLAKEHDLPIYIHGKAYKPGVEYLHGSYSLLIGHYVQELSGESVSYIDPCTGWPDDSYTLVKGVVLMAHHAPTTYSYTQEIGPKDQRFYCEFARGSVIVDIWRYLAPEDVPNCTLVRYGDTRIQ